MLSRKVLSFGILNPRPKWIVSRFLGDLRVLYGKNVILLPKRKCGLASLEVSASL
jgi:hypothetical protein